jgi:Tfp pilus assembly protein PilF
MQSIEGGVVGRLARFKAMLETDPTNQGLARQCIDLALQAHDYEFVLERTGMTLALTPSDTRAQFDRASALIGKREFEPAAQLLGAMLERDPEVVAARFNLGLCLVCLKRYEAARPHLDAVYRAGERPDGLLRLLVSTHHHLGLIEDAVSIADENPKPAADDPATAGIYALLYLDADLPEQAARWAAHALERNADCVDALLTQATLHTAQMQAADARSQYERVLQLAPSNGRAWIGLGALALLQNDFAAAKAQLARGIEHMPRHVGSWHVLAWTNLLTGELDEAERGFRKALDLDRNFAETHGALASIAALRGDRASAQRSIEVALRLDQQCLAAQFARSLLVGSAGGDPAAARKIVHRTITRLSQRDGGVVGRMLGRSIAEK